LLGVALFSHTSIAGGLLYRLINAIKSSGIEYVIAPGFAEEFYKNAVDMGLNLIKCSDSKSLEKGDNIEVHLREGLILNIDTEQECKFKLL
jgi:3-isopropylmalate dehydratase small subunit